MFKVDTIHISMYNSLTYNKDKGQRSVLIGDTNVSDVYSLNCTLDGLLSADSLIRIFIHSLDDR